MKNMKITPDSEFMQHERGKWSVYLRGIQKDASHSVADKTTLYHVNYWFEYVGWTNSHLRTFVHLTSHSYHYG
jgi:hypothetical protein